LRAPPFFAALFRGLVPRFALLFDAERLEPDDRFIAPPRLRLLELFLADVFLAPDFFAADFFVAAMIVPPDLELSTRPVPRWTSGWDGRARSGARPNPYGLVEATSRDLIEAGDAEDPSLAVERLRAIVPARHGSGETHSHIDDLLSKLFPAAAASAPEDAGRRGSEGSHDPGIRRRRRPRCQHLDCVAPAGEGPATLPHRSVSRNAGAGAPRGSLDFLRHLARTAAHSPLDREPASSALVASSVAQGSPLGDAADRAGGAAGGRGAGA